MKRLIFLIMFLISFISVAVEFAITMDDPNIYDKPLFSAIKRDQLILDQLKKKNVQAALFVAGKRIDSQAGKELLKRWSLAKHIIGNHTYSHKNFNNPKMTFNEYLEDFNRDENLIKQFKSFKKIFRFPFLKSGENEDKRNKMRKALRARKYRHGYVTIDASDWYISQRLEKKLKSNPKADLAPYRDFYLKHMWERASYYDNLIKQVRGSSPKHTILVHHNLLSALFLSDLIEHFESKGWKLINAEDAFDDPIFSYEANIIPSGEGIVWAIAKEKGIDELRYPAEDSVYEKEEMDRLGL